VVKNLNAKLLKLAKNELSKSIINLVLFVVIAFGIIFSLNWLKVPNPMFWRFALYALLIALGVPLWIETQFHNKLREEHDKLTKDLDRIKQDFENAKKEIVKHEARRKARRKPKRKIRRRVKRKTGRKAKPKPKRLRSQKRKK